RSCSPMGATTPASYRSPVIAAGITSSRPVRPVAHTWILTLGLRTPTAGTDHGGRNGQHGSRPTVRRGAWRRRAWARPRTAWHHLDPRLVPTCWAGDPDHFTRCTSRPTEDD